MAAVHRDDGGGFVVVALLMALLAVVVGGFVLIYRICRYVGQRVWAYAKGKRDERNAKAATPAPAASPKKSLSEPQFEPIPVLYPKVFREKKVPPVPGELLRVELKYGVLAIRFYSGQGIAKARLRPGTKTAIRRLGAHLHLEDRAVTCIRQARDEFTAEANQLLVGETQPRPQKRAQKPKAATSVEDEPFFDLPPLDAYGPPPEMGGADYEDLMPTPPPSPPPDVPVSPIKEKASSAKRRPFRKSLLTYTGEVLDMGKIDRSFGNRTSPHYRVLLHDDKLQAENPIWGADLERAVVDAMVRKGDRVRIAFMGETDVLIRGEVKVKKLWQITKI